MQTTTITPHHHLWHIDFGEIWRYRDLMMLFVRRIIVVQYKQTVLGPLWYIVQPILTVIMNMVVFGGIAKMSTDGVPQAIFYMAGNVCWFYFSDCLSRTSDTFHVYYGLFSKVYFPRLVIPIATVLSNLLRFLIQMGLFAAFYLYFFSSGADIHLGILFPSAPVIVNVFAFVFVLLLFVIMLAGLGLGFGILISSLTTKYRDLSFLFSFIIQLWMYATPIVYPISMVTNDTLRTVIMLNPVSAIIEAFKYVTLGQGYFSWLALSYSFFIMVVLLILGVVIFNKVQRSFMDTV